MADCDMERTAGISRNATVVLFSLAALTRGRFYDSKEGKLYLIPNATMPDRGHGMLGAKPPPSTTGYVAVRRSRPSSSPRARAAAPRLPRGRVAALSAQCVRVVSARCVRACCAWAVRELCVCVCACVCAGLGGGEGPAHCPPRRARACAAQVLLETLVSINGTKAAPVKDVTVQVCETPERESRPHPLAALLSSHDKNTTG